MSRIKIGCVVTHHSYGRGIVAHNNLRHDDILILFDKVTRSAAFGFTWSCDGQAPRGNGRYFCDTPCGGKSECQSTYCLILESDGHIYDSLEEILNA